MDARGANWLTQVQHLAAARRALELQDSAAALQEIDAALALGGNFAAAESLRRQILAGQTTRTEAQPHNRQPRPMRWMLPVATAVLIAGMALALHGALGIGRRASPPPAAAATVEERAPAPMKVFLARSPAQPAAAVGTPWISPRLTRLDVRPNWRAAAIRVADAALLRDLQEGVSQLWVGKVNANTDAIFLGEADEDDWTALTRSLKPRGVVWRISPSRQVAVDAARADGPAAAGFVRVKRLRYSEGFVAEQFTRQRVRIQK